MASNHKTLAAQNYGSATTIGARQTAMIAHIAEMTSLGSPVDIDTLRFLHGQWAVQYSLSALRSRRLVTGSNHNIRLTKKGEWYGRLTQQAKIPAGLGLVATRCPSRKP
ncbi:MAG: hypothetical protein EB060_11385 [Proteobacteria bacterium]|nr:hypothetical protein [Pseudomonadota bacterium]